MHSIFETLLKGDSMNHCKYLEVLSYLINRNEVQLKGFVYNIPDGMLWQNLEIVLKSKLN